ncbi:White collar 2 protein [Teratosphaeria destructans]|uniref:White collar 2 protein n=1 Tax=Teratosphaeria destructans TaxID=418781 RepID=A0A9W7SJW4_9PEZI|nr:White collar 2 protein [Teratosphaeria destructans]
MSGPTLLAGAVPGDDDAHASNSNGFGSGTGGAEGDLGITAPGTIDGLELDGLLADSGLDIDMNLPMDLDMDMDGQVSSDPSGFAPLAAQANTSLHETGAIAGELDRSGPKQDTGNNELVTNSAPPQESNSNGAGAGPLPTGFGMGAPNNSSTLTEFTKRRNWSQRIIEELKDFLHILTPDGRILYVSPSCNAITGYEPPQLIGKFMGEFVHPDDSGIFMREFNESIASGNALRFFYRFKKDDGTYMIFECDGHPHISHEHAPNGSPMKGLCRGFFMMARPYPTKNAALLDSFLEHKIENERLIKRIEDLKREEAEETAEQDRLLEQASASRTGATPSESQGPSGSQAPGNGVSEQDYQGMPPPAKPSISNTALTRQNLDSALSAQRPDSIADKMSRYEASGTHMESIELMTGLRYRDGERSHGISTGDASPALIRGDAGIAILLDKDRDGGKKEKKKQKVADEYVCADCGTLDSPEWRKGPKGPKTLCNACGLRWAKKEKKRSGDDGPGKSPQQGGPAPPGAPLQPSLQMVGLTATGLPPGLPMQTSTESS